MSTYDRSRAARAGAGAGGCRQGPRGSPTGGVDHYAAHGFPLACIVCRMLGGLLLLLLVVFYLGWIASCLIRGWWPNRDGYLLEQRYWPWGHKVKRR